MKQQPVQISAPASAGSRRHFRAGETIFRQGDPGSTLLFVLTGNVIITKDEIEIAGGGAGEFFGEMSLLENSPRFASVIAKTDCEALEYNITEFLKLVRNEPEFAVAVMRNLSRKLRDSDSTRITELEESNDLLQSKNSELARLNDFLEKVIDKSPAGISIVDHDGKIELINPAGRRMLNLGERDVLPQFTAFFPENSPLQDLRARKMSTWSSQYAAHVDNVKKTFFVSISHTRATQEIDRYLVNFEDISELIELNEQVIKLDRFANEAEMASEIAHSINNYLTVISGNLELIHHRMAAALRTQFQRPMEDMRSSIEEIVKYVEGLMGARDDSGVFLPKDLHEIVNVMLRVLKPQKRFGRIELNVDVAPDFPRSVNVCEARFHQVLLNLLINAADALNQQMDNQQPQIRIELTTLPVLGRVQICIADNGPGVAAEKLDQLFVNRFTTKEKGHGIGLLTVKRIIDIHSGTIDVESAPGQGTIFKITLPV